MRTAPAGRMRPFRMWIPTTARGLPRNSNRPLGQLTSAVEAPAAIAPSYRTSTDHRGRISRIESREDRSGPPEAPASSAICRQDTSVTRHCSYCPSAVERSSQASAAAVPARKASSAGCCQAALVVSSCWTLEPACGLLIAIRRGFIASGISRTNSIWSRPLSNAAPFTWT